MGSSCSSTTSAFRFKNFVVAVYPEEHDGELNRDALGKLQSYVASNPERIPRVCRKISKLIDADVRKGNVKRVGVGMQILRDLLDNASELETFVPYVTTICIALLENGIVEHRISAADVIAALCHRIVERSTAESTSSPAGGSVGGGSSMDHARRLVADSKDKLSLYLRDMMIEGVGTNDIISLHCRYAAVVALGNLSLCIQSALSGSVNDLVLPVLSNFHHLLKETAVTSSSRVNQRRRQRSENISSLDEADYKAPKTVVLPVEAGDKDAAFFRACLSATSALALCCTTAAVPSFLGSVAQYCTSFHGWTLARFPPLVYRAITFALQKGTQPLGINVCHHLCDIAEESAGTERYPAVLRSLTAAIALIPMTGGRPGPIIEVLKSSLTSGFVLRLAAVPDGEHGTSDADRRAALVEQSHDALIDLCRTLIKRIVAQGNILQLARAASELSSLASKQLPRPVLRILLELLAVVAPYTSGISIDDAHVVATTTPSGSGSSNVVVNAISPFLLSSDSLRIGAARVLASMVGLDVSAQLHQATSTLTGHAPPGGVNPALASIMDDARCWVGKSTFTTDHTPQSVIETVNVLSSLVYRQRWESLGYVLPWIALTQKNNASLIPITSSVAAEGGAIRQITALQQAWLFATVVLLKVVGDVLNVPPLSAYAQDIIHRRREADPCELGIWFQMQLRHSSPTTSGMLEERGEGETALAPLNVPPVTNLITIGTVIVYLCQSSDAQLFLKSIGAASESVAEQRIESLFGEVQLPSRRAPLQRPPSRNSFAPQGGGGANSSNANSARLPMSQSFGNLLKREDSSSSNFFVRLPTALSTKAMVACSPSAHYSRGIAEDVQRDTMPASEKVRVVLAKLKKAAPKPPVLITSCTPMPLKPPLSPSVRADDHIDPQRDLCASRNSSFVGLSSSVGPMGASIVMSTAKTLRLHKKASAFEAAQLSTNNSSFVHLNSQEEGSTVSTYLGSVLQQLEL